MPVSKILPSFGFRPVSRMLAWKSRARAGRDPRVRSGRGRRWRPPAEAAPDLKRLAGKSAAGRKLSKPVCHYSLSWAKIEALDRQEMSRAAAEGLKALGRRRTRR